MGVNGNVITNLIPVIYESLDTVCREQIGFIPAVARDSQAVRCAVNEVVRWPIVPTFTASAMTTGAYGPEPNDTTVNDATLAITKEYSVKWYEDGNNQMALGNTGLYSNIQAMRFQQAFRTLANEVESDLAGLYYGASRAYGTAGTNPFDRTDIDAATQLRKIIEDNGAPTGNLHLIVNTACAQKLRTQKQIVSVAESGSASGLRQGAVGDICGWQIGVSGQIKTHTAGSLTTAARTDGAQALSSTTLTLTKGVGTVLKGDVMAFNSTLYGVGEEKYVSATTASDNTTITINAPGVTNTAIPTDSTVTLSSAYRANLGFDTNAIMLATRVPAMPQGGDSADDVMIVQDPVSGLAFQIAVYRQHRRVAWEVGIAWGVKVAKSEHVALLLS